MFTSKTSTPAFVSVTMVTLGGSLGLASYVGAFVISMQSVPRYSEGIRQVVAIPWPTYLALPAAVAFIPLIGIGLMTPVRKWSRAFIVGFCLATAIGTIVGSNLLRRDYIGKF